jgi:DNA-binding HxlR family transcriptional regulator
MCVLRNAPSAGRPWKVAIGIRGATLTHHLNAMERAGLLTRQRQPDNRRLHRVELTASGLELFLACREAAVAFDRKLRQQVDPERLSDFADVLDQLRRRVAPGYCPSANASGPPAPGRPRTRPTGSTSSSSAAVHRAALSSG